MIPHVVLKNAGPDSNSSAAERSGADGSNACWEVSLVRGPSLAHPQSDANFEGSVFSVRELGVSRLLRRHATGRTKEPFPFVPSARKLSGWYEC